MHPLICPNTQGMLSNASLHAPWPQGNNGLGLCCDLMSVSSDTGTAAVESEGAAGRLEAVFLYGLHTLVHLWALAHFGRIPPMQPKAIVNGVVVHKYLHP